MNLDNGFYIFDNEEEACIYFKGCMNLPSEILDLYFDLIISSYKNYFEDDINKLDIINNERILELVKCRYIPAIQSYLYLSNISFNIEIVDYSYFIRYNYPIEMVNNISNQKLNLLNKITGLSGFHSYTYIYLNIDVSKIKDENIIDHLKCFYIDKEETPLIQLYPNSLYFLNRLIRFLFEL